jgi:hypothetical protein
MTYNLNAPNIVPVWTEIGETDPKSRLLAHIRIAGVDMHLEAREVAYDGDLQTTVDYPDDHDALCNIAGGAVTTATIDGREYFLFALPFGI